MTSVWPERLEDRLEREQVLGPVVDEQDRFAGHARCRRPRLPAASSSRSGGASRSPRAAATASASVAASAASRHLAGAPPSRGPGRSRRRRAPGSRARPARRRRSRPVRTTPTARSPYASAADSNSTSIDGRRTARGSSVESAKRPRLDEQVVVGRREVDVPRLDRVLVLGLATPAAACATASRSLELRRVRVGARGAARRRRRRRGRRAAPSSRRLQRRQASPGRADHDQLVPSHFDLPVDAARSASSSS